MHETLKESFIDVIVLDTLGHFLVEITWLSGRDLLNLNWLVAQNAKFVLF